MSDTSQANKRIAKNTLVIYGQLVLRMFLGLFTSRLALYRFLQEPRRLFKRYFIDDPKFFWYFGKQLLGLYKDPFA